MANFDAAARRVMDDPGAVLEPQCILSACAAVEYRWRRRVLDPVLTIVAMAVQVMHRNAAIAHVVRLMHAGFSESAYCQARQRLPLEVLTRLLGMMTAGVRARTHAPEAPGWWRGHRTLLIDGTGVSMPDTPALAAHFGYPGSVRPGCGFPVARLLAVFDAATGLLTDALAAPFCTGEQRLAARVHALLRPGDVLVGDRGFGSFAQVAVLLALGVHGVFRHNGRRERARTGRRGKRGRPSRRPHGGHPPTTLVRRLGRGDELVEWARRAKAVWLSPEEFERLPRTLTMRVVRRRTGRPGWRTRELVVVTTLLDPVRYPAAAIAELYGVRWSIENSLRCLKQTMGMDVLRCRSVEGVRKELAMFALVYNLVRLVMLESAARQGVEPSRVSFADALRWLACADADEPVPRLKINPRRADRWEPRFIKRRPSRAYPLLTLPRPKARDYVLKHQRRLI